MQWYLAALKSYAAFSGRARRKEYWMFSLYNTLIFFALIFALTFTAGSRRGGGTLGLLAYLYALATFIPSLAVTVRRLHDTGRSGWWMLINLIPFVGEIVFLLFLASDGQPGRNDYGQNPKEVAV